MRDALVSTAERMMRTLGLRRGGAAEPPRVTDEGRRRELCRCRACALQGRPQGD